MAPIEAAYSYQRFHTAEMTAAGWRSEPRKPEGPGQSLEYFVGLIGFNRLQW